MKEWKSLGEYAHDAYFKHLGKHSVFNALPVLTRNAWEEAVLAGTAQATEGKHCEICEKVFKQGEVE